MTILSVRNSLLAFFCLIQGIVSAQGNNARDILKSPKEVIAASVSPSSDSVAAQQAIVLDSQQFTLRQPYEELTCKLGELRADRDYAVVLVIKNSTQGNVIITRVQTSCGCVAATSETGKSIEPGTELKVTLAISLNDAKAVDRVVSLITEADNKELVFATVRLTADVIQPVKVSPTTVVIEADEVNRRVEFKLSSILSDVSLKNTEILLVSDWASAQRLNEKTDREIIASVLLEPKKETEVTTQMFAKFSYTDKHGLHVTEVPIYLSRKAKLSVRPESLKFLVDDANQVVLKLFLVGQFDASAATKLVVYQCDKEKVVFKEPLISTEVRATNERILVFSTQIAADNIKQAEGFFKIQAMSESVFVPFQFVKE